MAEKSNQNHGFSSFAGIEYKKTGNGSVAAVAVQILPFWEGR